MVLQWCQSVTQESSYNDYAVVLVCDTRKVVKQASCAEKVMSSRGQYADSRQQRSESRQQKRESRQKRADHREQTSEGKKQIADSRERTADSREQRTRGQRAESTKEDSRQ
jgi:hypothetical protein